MLRDLLKDRFKLGFHREPKQLSIYALSVAKGGVKLKESSVTPDATPEGFPPLVFVVSPTVVRLPARYATMSEFASVFKRSPLDRPVVDRTGLSDGTISTCSSHPTIVYGARFRLARKIAMNRTSLKLSKSAWGFSWRRPGDRSTWLSTGSSGLRRIRLRD